MVHLNPTIGVSKAQPFGNRNLGRCEISAKNTEALDYMERGNDDEEQTKKMTK